MHVKRSHGRVRYVETEHFCAYHTVECWYLYTSLPIYGYTTPSNRLIGIYYTAKEVRREIKRVLSFHS